VNAVYLLVLLALLQFMYFSARVGFARHKYGVEAPHTSGNETWERIFRVQQNTLEQLVVFIPGMLAFAQFVSPRWALLPGVLYLAGRQLYSWGYVRDASKRGAGFTLTFTANVVLVAGGTIGLVLRLVS
jgi:glutathione S-transferase